MMMWLHILVVDPRSNNIILGFKVGFSRGVIINKDMLSHNIWHFKNQKNLETRNSKIVIILL